MKSKKAGTSISGVEVTNISSHGIWLYLYDKEYFLSYDEYPWFRHAKIAEILNVKLLNTHHLHWPDLDVDLTVDSLDHPERYPLTAKSDS